MKTMKTIAFFNAKGGVGSTMLAGCTTIFATEACIDVVGASLDPRRDLRRWMDHQDIPWIDAIADVPQPDLEYRDLLVLDVHAGTGSVDVIRPDLWVVPMDSQMAYEHAVRLAPMRHGPELWVWNNVLGDGVDLPDSVPPYRRTVPEHLTPRVEFAPQIIHRDPWIAAVADEFMLPRGKGPAQALYQFIHSLLFRVDLVSTPEYVPGEQSLYRRCRDDADLVRAAEVPAYLQTHARRELEARQRLQAFFAR
jgi:hypothetical protein